MRPSFPGGGSGNQTTYLYRCGSNGKGAGGLGGLPVFEVHLIKY